MRLRSKGSRGSDLCSSCLCRMQLRLYLTRLRPSAVRCCSFGSSLKFWERLKVILCVWSNHFFIICFLLHRYAQHYGCILTVISLFISFPVRKCWWLVVPLKSQSGWCPDILFLILSPSPPYLHSICRFGDIGWKEPRYVLYPVHSLLRFGKWVFTLP